MLLIKAKQVKSLLQAKGLRTSTCSLEAINEEVKKICFKTADNVISKEVKTVKAVHVPKIDCFLKTSAPTKD